MRWNEILYSPSENNPRLLFGHIIILMIFDAILYLLLTLYLEQVLPGPFGAPQKWYFFLQKSYWKGIPKADGEFDKLSTWRLLSFLVLEKKFRLEVLFLLILYSAELWYRLYYYNFFSFIIVSTIELRQRYKKYVKVVGVKVRSDNLISIKRPCSQTY